MKTSKLLFALASVFTFSSILMTVGCMEEVRHTEVDTKGAHGQRKHEESTVYKNADGTTVIEKERRTTN